MLRASFALAALLAAGACKSESGADPAEVETSPQVQKGSAGGFSASLGAELGAGSGSGSSMAGSGSGSGSSMPAGSGAMTSPTPSSSPPADAAVTTPATSPGPSPIDAGIAKAAPPPDAATTAAGSAAKSPTPTPTPTQKPRPVMTAELQAIKLTMLPNWERDVVEAGSISLYEKNTNATFKFNYGYDDPKAPTDREAYKKFLADSKILTVTLDRQSGASWYMQGTDASGKGAFRILVTYGGKRLVCGGSLYKDSPFGDLRDAVLIQAKQICESIQL